ncbi:hypothetical protein D1631_17175 [Chryseobacterium nematophagum]|uniref:Uncharacterized protein n=1 Tax=Chryseobacterium nematophagum TaxID=2305228 RepID=A0A3M7TLR3_9FLAO|nr:hypothetical protein [Chryseobacterium nematophagum]RNA63519.1 hypothetical protein D1631_17175 [Chryseobacterium nematophagum]
MLNLTSNQLTNSELPVITDNYTVLHFDEYPILFTGTNKYGNKIIGSFCDEDDETNTLIYFTIIVSDKDFSNFYKKKISYRELILNSNEIFILEKNYNNKILKSYFVPISDIPLDYIPLESSFIPDKYIVSESLSYSFSLKGKLADLHKALVDDINSINSKIYNYLNESLQTLNIFGITSKIFSQPSNTGSYRLNFDIDFIPNPQLNFFEVDKDKVTEFINQYLNYISQTLPHEKEDFLNNHTEESEDFSIIQNSFKEIFHSSHQEPVSTVSDILIDSINNVAEKLSDVSEFMKSNDSFNSIEVGIINQGQFLSNGTIDSNYKSIVDSKLLSTDTTDEEIKVVSDETPQNYRILVFRINSETGKGGARLYPDSSEKHHKIALTVHTNKKDLANSIFTESLYEDKVVDVMGIATSIDGVYKKIECYL